MSCVLASGCLMDIFTCSISYMQSKSYCEDLTEGKFSFPIIHAIKSCPQDTRLLNILRQRPEDHGIKKHAVQWMVQCGSLTYTRTVLTELKNQLFQDLDALGGHAGLRGLIAKLDQQLDVEEKEMLQTFEAQELITTL
jgi:geranylgeranyl diphosphate synthase, type III